MASAAQAAAHIDLSRVAFAELIARNIIEKPAEQGGYDLDAVRVAYLRHLRKVASGRSGGSGGDQLISERVALTAAKRRREERQDAIEAGRFVPIEPVVRGLQAQYMAMRDRLLGIAGTTAYVLTGQPEEDFRIIDDAVRAALEDIANPEFAKGMIIEAIKGDVGIIPEGAPDEP